MKPEPPPLGQLSKSDAQQSDEDKLSTENPDQAVVPLQETTSEMPKSSWLHRLWGPLVFLLVLAFGGLALVKHDEILDWAITRNYQPTATVQEITQQTAMSAYGQRLFYVNRPIIEDKEAFNLHCTNASEEVAVLGCYRGNRQGIYLYNVTDARLHGIQQVTAAHEMLHQAYDRLSNKERKRIDALLEEYANTITDKNLIDKLTVYKKTEPKDVDNEMHSVFGTEVDTLPPGLEAYYKQYFGDRKKVLAFHAQYQAAFSERTAQIATYDKQLAEIKPQIESQKEDLDVKEAQLRNQRAAMDADLTAGKVEAYNAQVASFNAQVTAYKAEIAHVNALISQYNQIIDARNKIAVEEQDLIRAQDSHASSLNQQ